MTARSTDVPLDLIERLAPDSGEGERRGVAIRRLADTPVDLRVFHADARELEGPAGRATLDRLSADPIVERVQRKGGELAIRLRESYVEALGARLRERDDDLGRLRVLEGRRIALNYLNPNATKPLHVGHLRNVSIGAAWAAGLRLAGASVVEQCYVCDIGRNVCEALAGWELFHADEDPLDLGVPPDQFVGRCYADYVRSLAGGGNGAAHDPVASEGVAGDDRADQLIRAWLRGDPTTLAAWRKLRRYALDGQRATLARLGLAFERVFLESDSLEAVHDFVERGVSAGVFQRASDGSVSYPAGRREFASLPLVRADGFPTEHARVIGLFLIEQRECFEVASADGLPLASIDRWAVVCGDEWGSAGDVALEIVRRLGPSPLADRVEVLAHGMVMLAGSKMKSRDGKALLIDDFLDRVLASEPVRDLVARYDAVVSAEDVAEIAVKSFFLFRNVSKSFEFEWDAFCDPRMNGAWTLARAWCAVHRDVAVAGPRDDASDHRIAAMQYHQHRQLLGAVSAEFHGTEMIKFAVGLAKWYLERAPSRRLAEVVREVLARSLRSCAIAAARRAVHSSSTTST